MASVLAGKKIVVGVSGSIAAFKVVGWVSSLTKEEAQVSVIMTDSAQKFIGPLSFSALTGSQPYLSMFDDGSNSTMAHIELAQEADLFLIAPATAQTIARLAHGMADDLLSATVLASRAPILICPAMNSMMYLHQATIDNIQRCKGYGYSFIDPGTGMMACKDEGPGRLAEWEDVQRIIEKHLTPQDLEGKKVLITAGPTREAIDPARFISNRSSGKMGYALAAEAHRRGAEVVLISGPTTLTCPTGVRREVISSAEEMEQAVNTHFKSSDIVIKSAAVSDFRPEKSHPHKVKKEDCESSIKLKRNSDILKALGQKRKKAQILVGFAAESQNLVEEGKRKLKEKNLDLIVVNDIGKADSGFESDNNKVVLLEPEGQTDLPYGSKMQISEMIWGHICNNLM